MIRRHNLMFYSIFAQQTYKLIVTKMCASITNDGPERPKSSQDIFFKKFTTNLKSFLDRAVASTHLKHSQQQSIYSCSDQNLEKGHEVNSLHIEQFDLKHHLHGYF